MTEHSLMIIGQGINNNGIITIKKCVPLLVAKLAYLN